MLPLVCPVLIATAKKTIRPYCPESKNLLLPVQRVRCCNYRFGNQPHVLFFHIVFYPCRQLATHPVQLQFRICPPRSAKVDLGDFFSSRFVFYFLTTPQRQSRPMGSEIIIGATEIHNYLHCELGRSDSQIIIGATEIHNYLQSRKGYFGGNYSVL